MIINGILIILLGLCIFWHIYQKRKTYREIDRLLNCVLEREEIVYPDVREREMSALVSRLNRIQEALMGQVTEAEKEKEQVKSLVSNMSHQLKTPLANLFLYTEILDTPDIGEEKRAQAVWKIRKQADKLDFLISSLMKMVKLEQNVISFETEDASLRETLLNAVDMVYEKIEKKGLVLISEPYEDILLNHNRKWTAEVFVNILENAVKYTDRGGMIRIQVCPYEIYTEIRFIDNGQGIPGDELTQIFKRFYRGRDAEHVEGSGIGLYLSNLILEKEKGYMTVKSVYGEGSCFSVFLQCTKRMPALTTKEDKNSNLKRKNKTETK
ncbi:MAG: HAMP domain-containing histidine kinase [Lachnospiraceae bacterium]